MVVGDVVRKPLARRAARVSVESLVPDLLASNLLEVALDRGRGLALANGGGFFVELAAAYLGQDASLLAGALEAP